MSPAFALQLAASAAHVLIRHGFVEDGPAAPSGPADGSAGTTAEWSKATFAAAFDARPGPRPVAVIGRDPRASGEMLEAAVAAGLASAGVDVLLLGVVPTPGVAYLTAALRADLGVVISASHNPMPDNGIKLFAAGGVKLADSSEQAIEDDMAARARDSSVWVPPIGADVGRIRLAHGAVARYVTHLLDAVPTRLDGLRLVVDCAHGAASDVAPEVYRRAGAEVSVIAGAPDGLNINDGVGSTHLQGLRAAVLDRGADLGLAHDGDADRCLAIAADGSDIDGDDILAILATGMRARGRLVGNTVVGTVMANLGFHHAMRHAGIELLTTAVGDRYVLEAMRDGGYNLGGEQSGHVVLSDHATTGDGLLTGLLLMSEMVTRGRSLGELGAIVTRLPQTLVNVTVVDKGAVSDSPHVEAAVAAAQRELGDRGRVLLRPSGTEPLVRVMVEAPTSVQAARIAEQVAAVVRTVTQPD